MKKNLLASVGIIFILLTLLIFLFPHDINAQVVINELMPNPVGSDTDNEWIEVFNNSSSTIDLNGYILKDNGGAKLIIDNTKVDTTTQIISNGFLVIRRNGHTTFSLNNDTDVINLYRQDEITLEDSFTYTGSTENKTWGRIPDGAGIYTELLNGSPGSTNQIASIATPTPTTSVTPTPTTAPTKATLKINKCKDEDGGEVGSVEIFINSVYIHNLVNGDQNDTLEFCVGCTCGGYTNCNLGSNVVMLKKDGFKDWSQTINLVAGENIEISPVLEANTSSTSSSSTNTPIPTPRLTVSSSPKATNTPSPSVKTSDDLSGASEALVLGLRNELESNQDSAERGDGMINKKIPIGGIVFIVLGAILFVVSIILFIKKSKIAGNEEQNTQE